MRFAVASSSPGEAACVKLEKNKLRPCSPWMQTRKRHWGFARQGVFSGPAGDNGAPGSL